MTTPTTEKTPFLHDTGDVFCDDDSFSSDEEWDYNQPVTPTSFKASALDPRRQSCISLARSWAPPPQRRPASFRRRVRTCFTTGAILIAILLERMSYYGIVGNLVLFCTNGLGLSSTTGVTIDLIFIGKLYTYRR